MARLGREQRSGEEKAVKKERGKGEGKKGGETTEEEGRGRGGLADRPPRGAAWADPVAAAASPSPARAAAARRVNGQGPGAQPLAGRGEAAPALGDVRGPDRPQECTTARPARPSAPAGRAPLPGTWAAALELGSPPGAGKAR